MKHFQDLNNLPEINFKSKERPVLEELANYIDRMKQDLFDEKWSQATKKHIKTSLVLYIRSMQKQLAPMGHHYKAVDMKGKQHLEHVIPQNKIITAYLHDKISSRWVLQMPLCLRVIGRCRVIGSIHSEDINTQDSLRPSKMSKVT